MRIFDLCSGIGGFRVGLELSKVSDYKFVAFSDIDKYANKAYKAIFNTKNEVELGDIQLHTRNVEELDLKGLLPFDPKREELINKHIPDFEMLVSGFPCQPHSLMGKREGKGDRRGDLFYDILEILRFKQPKYFILENVKALTSVNKGSFFNEIIYRLENDIEYNVKTVILNASDFGIPQTRRRIFIVGSKSAFPFQSINIKKVDLSKSEYPSTWHLLEKEVNEKYFLSDRILKTILKDQHKGYNRKAEINKLIARPITKTMHKMHRASQDNYYSEKFIYGNYSPSSHQVVLSKNHENRIRRITPREALRIQSFPESYINKLIHSGLSDTRLYMVAGNAVPPKLVKSLINSIF